MNTSAFLRPAQAARVWPHCDRPPHPSKILRRILDGVKSHKQPGHRIKLQAVHDGQSWLTTKEWIEEHVATITADRGGHAPKASVEARAKRARERLAAAGW
jgi:hypothetical protein